MSPEHAGLLIVDIQDTLAPAIEGIEGIVVRKKALITAACRLDVPILFPEQYPKGLGHTDPSLTDLAPEAQIYEKIHFGAADEPDFRTRLEGMERKEITGTEAHIFGLQTALGWHEGGYRVRFCADKVIRMFSAVAGAFRAPNSFGSTTLATASDKAFKTHMARHSGGSPIALDRKTESSILVPQSVNFIRKSSGRSLAVGIL